MQQLLLLIGNFGVGVTLGLIVVYLVFKFFIPSYFSEKGKNLATKEDIASITDKVESVKTDYAKVIEELRSDHQLKLAATEREKTTKKEVYLQAVEAITRIQNIISSFSNLNIDEQTLTSNMILDSGLIAKIQVVGTEETVKATSLFMSAIGTAILELMLERSSLIGRKHSIELAEEYRVKSSNEIERYISIMKNINLEGNQDKRLWGTINNNIDFESKQRDKYANEISDLWKLQNSEHLVFTQKCMDRFFEISKLLPPIVLSVRNELDLEISNDAYLEIFMENINKGKAVFDDFLTNIKNA